MSAALTYPARRDGSIVASSAPCDGLGLSAPVTRRMQSSGSTEPSRAFDSDDLIELLFFAYRDFVGDPDRILAEYGFGRAHHRVLHFVDRYPGLTIAELLDILRITKQSLNRVLKDLIGQGYVVQRAGPSDRRQRLLFCTDAGMGLAADLARVQARRLAQALAAPSATGSPKEFLMAMIEPDDRAGIRRLMARRGSRT